MHPSELLVLCLYQPTVISEYANYLQHKYPERMRFIHDLDIALDDLMNTEDIEMEMQDFRTHFNLVVAFYDQMMV